MSVVSFTNLKCRISGFYPVSVNCLMLYTPKPFHVTQSFVLDSWRCRKVLAVSVHHLPSFLEIVNGILIVFQVKDRDFVLFEK
jgi:hypothetical protein